MRLKERWTDTNEVLRPAPSTVSRKHETAVKAIAEQLFAYPSPEYPHFRTFVNEPEVTQRIFTNFGRELTPDIVVVEWPERIVRIVAEVVVPEQLTLETAQNAWLPESCLNGVAFYLYLPAGYLREGKDLLKKAGIRRRDVNLRTWRHNAGMDRMEVVFIK